MKYFFRGIRTDNGEMIHGNLFQDHDGSCQIAHNDFNFSHTWQQHDVIPGTVAIWTGLTDKNDNQIWSNSWIKNASRNGGKPHSVVYENGAFYGSYDNTNYLIGQELKEIEVVHPEIVKQ